MKPNPTLDYPVSVLPESAEVTDRSRASLYEGIYRMTLNYRVDVVFVPDVSAATPPWDGRGLPADFDDVRDPIEARRSVALSASYVVTPNAARAGTTERFAFGGRENVVRYVTPAEFARFAADFPALGELVGTVRPRYTVSGLREFGVVRFVEAEIVDQPWLAPTDAAWLGRGPGNDRSVRR